MDLSILIQLKTLVLNIGQAAIKKHDQEAYDILLKNAENKRDGYLKKAGNTERSGRSFYI